MFSCSGSAEELQGKESQSELTFSAILNAFLLLYLQVRVNRLGVLQLSKRKTWPTIFAKTPREGKEKGKGYHSSGRVQQEEKAMFSADEVPGRHESPSEC